MALNALAGTWALLANWQPGLRHRQLWWFTATAQLAIFVEVALGVAITQSNDVEARGFHSFYGFVALFTVAILYAYRDQLGAHRHLLYGGGGLFLMGLALRAITLDAV